MSNHHPLRDFQVLRQRMAVLHGRVRVSELGVTAAVLLEVQISSVRPPLEGLLLREHVRVEAMRRGGRPCHADDARRRQSW